MKKVILIGSTGHIGSAILNELINRGHQVTAVTRNANKIVLKADNLSIVEADIENESSIIEISKGADAVISAYNPGWANPNIYKDTLKNYLDIFYLQDCASTEYFIWWYNRDLNITDKLKINPLKNSKLVWN